MRVKGKEPHSQAVHAEEVQEWEMTCMQSAIENLLNSLCAR